MEPKWTYAFGFGDWTPQTSAENMTIDAMGPSLGNMKSLLLDFGW